jgi:transcriptional regulator with XRE-family HTH domain
LDNEELEVYSETMLDTISANVQKYRIEKGFTQIQLSLDIGMTGGAYLGRAELRKDNHHFNIKHLVKISKVLDVPIANFFLNSDLS